MELARRKLGRTAMEVTALGYGAMELRGVNWRFNGRTLAPGQAKQVLNAILDSGINFIDTSIDYGPSEELIGEHISHRRKEYFLASKCGCIVDPAMFTPEHRMTHIFTRKNIIDGVEQSLRRMKTDYLDLLQVHNAPSRSELERDEAAQTMLDLKRQGKVRFIGCSTMVPHAMDHLAMGVFEAFQIPYSALQREHEAIITEAARVGAGTIIRGGVARGEPGEGQGSADTWKLWERARMDELLEGMTPTQFMLRFTLSHPGVSTTIVGSLNPDHVKDNVATAAKGPLPHDVFEEAKRRLAAAGAVPK